MCLGSQHLISLQGAGTAGLEQEPICIENHLFQLQDQYVFGTCLGQMKTSSLNRGLLLLEGPTGRGWEGNFLIKVPIAKGRFGPG